MRKIAEIVDNKNIQVIEIGVDGGCGLFKKGPLKGASVIWSFGGGWEHVSIAPKSGTPTWQQMCELKSMFWNESECVIQYHPSNIDYVNLMENCLHLWRPIEEYNGKIPVPPIFMV